MLEILGRIDIRSKEPCKLIVIQKVGAGRPIIWSFHEIIFELARVIKFANQRKYPLGWFLEILTTSLFVMVGFVDLLSCDKAQQHFR